MAIDLETRRPIPHVPAARPTALEADLAEAEALLQRLLEAEDRIGLVFPIMDGARRFLAGRRHRRSGID